MNTDRAAVITHKHIARVRQLLGEFAIEMIKRGDRHDASKFERGESPTMNLVAACDKYQISSQMRSILFNTAERLGYKP